MTTPTEPLPVESADTKEHTADLARDIAQKITQGITEPSGQPRQTLRTPEEAARSVDPVEGASPEPVAPQEGAGAQPAALVEGEPAQEPELEPEPVDVAKIRDLETTLTELGIDMGVSLDQVPADFQDVYASMLRSAVVAATDVSEREMEASRVLQQVDEFRTKLRDQPDKIMIAMALQFPEVFGQVAGIAERMTSDEDFKQSVIRELEADARLAEAQRIQTLYGERDVRAQARKVILATERAANRYSVDPKLAEQVVALTVKANNGHLEANEVDAIVKDLQGRSPKAPRTMTAARAATAREAPSQPTPAVAPTAPASAGLKESTANAGAGGRFRSLVRDAFRKGTTVDR